jgi:hypothetical protein
VNQKVKLENFGEYQPSFLVIDKDGSKRKNLNEIVLYSPMGILNIFLSKAHTQK